MQTLSPTATNQYSFDLTNPKIQSRLFYFFLIIHLVIWTLLPALTRNTVSHDAIEAFVWAQHLDWGYDKNPWLIGWLTKLGIFLNGTNHNAIGYYFLQQSFIVLGFWSVWQLARQLLGSTPALVTTLLLEGSTYFSAYVETNNDNYILIGLWSTAILYFYRACKTENFYYWLVTFFLLALAMMAKYSTVMLSIPLLVFLLSDSAARKNFRNKGFYLGLFIGALVCLPNLIWLSDHQWISFQYLLGRKEIDLGTSFFTQHVIYPFQFIKRLITDFSLCILLFLMASRWEFVFRLKRSQQKINSFDQLFLWVVGIGPLMTVIILAAILGWQLYWEWGVPFVPLWGLLLYTSFRPVIDIHSLRRFLISIVILILLSSTAYVVFNTELKPGGSADYPAQEIADQVTQLWQEQYHTKLRYVGGSRYTAGYVGFYSKDKPLVFAEWNPLYSPGVNQQDLEKYGAIFISDGYYGTTVLNLPDEYSQLHTFPKSILKKYPRIKVQPIQYFSWLREYKHAPVTVLIGILPPQPDFTQDH